MTPKPVTMWAAILVGNLRHPEIDTLTVRETEIGSRAAFLKETPNGQRFIDSGTVRFARVVVAEEGGK